ncbi:hypothetical protein CJ030_MR4G021205 [Morella rubra]|uniref:Clp R domain-containing protein n=1 Tax=Morella rubra TaxID=262757 RepID=A0A6A1VYH9_9ROSI|nr:hypothetical protein CJ030_MR4G021205 [Morella rubra]
MAAQILSKLPTTTSAPFSQSCSGGRPDTYPSHLVRSLRLQSLPRPWLGTNTQLLQSSNIRPLVPKHRLIAATVSFSLPTAWSRRAIKSFAMAELEARKLKYPTTGTEALLMGILVEVLRSELLLSDSKTVVSNSTSLASMFVRANGITLFKVREETIKLLGKADMYFFSQEHPPLTEAAQRSLDWAIDQKLKSGDGGEITASHLLLGIWSEVESPGQKIMATLGFSDEKAKELESLSSEPGVVDD